MCPTTNLLSSMAIGHIQLIHLIISRRPPAGLSAALSPPELPWGAAYAIGREIWDDFDWRHGNIDIDIDRNVNIDADRNFNKWEHNSYHRRGVAYNNADVKNKFNKANINASDRKLDYRGRSEEQVLKPGNKPGGGGLKPGGDNRPDLGGNGERPGGRPDIGQIEKGLKDRPGKAANLPAQKPDLGKAKPKGKGPLAGLSLRARGPLAGTPSILAMGPRRKTLPSVGRRASAIAAKRISNGRAGEVPRSKVAAARAWGVAAARAWEAVRAVEVMSPAAAADAVVAAVAAAAGGGVLTSASSKTLPRWCGLATASSSTASATRAATARSMSVSWRRRCSGSTQALSLLIATDICGSTTTGSG